MPLKRYAMPASPPRPRHNALSRSSAIPMLRPGGRQNRKNWQPPHNRPRRERGKASSRGRTETRVAPRSKSRPRRRPAPPLDRPGGHVRAASSASPSTRTTGSTLLRRGRRPAACGRRRTPAPPGRRSSTTRARTRSAASPSTRRTRTSSGSAPARTTASAASATATASTSRRRRQDVDRTSASRTSEHIGQIVDRPARLERRLRRRAGAAVGAGGDRGLYKTTDGGKTWKQGARRSARTPASPTSSSIRANPDVLYAARLPAPPARLDAHQRRPRARRSTSHRRRQDVDEARRAACRTATWAASAWPIAPTEPGRRLRHRRGGRQAGRHLPLAPTAARPGRSATTFDQQAQYYAQIVVDPTNTDRVYVDERAHPGLRRRRQDASRRSASGTSTSTTTRSGSTRRHRPPTSSAATAASTRATTAAPTWRLQANLPVTQFYDVDVDNATPFYNVYGGTQDNFTLGGPSRTRSVARHHQRRLVRRPGRRRLPAARSIPNDPNIVYAESQYGGLVRFDRRTGERVDIQPQPGTGEPPLRWNWDSPLDHQPAHRTRGSTSRAQHALPQRRPRRHVEGRSAPT